MASKLNPIIGPPQKKTPRCPGVPYPYAGDLNAIHFHIQASLPGGIFQIENEVHFFYHCFRLYMLKSAILP